MVTIRYVKDDVSFFAPFDFERVRGVVAMAGQTMGPKLFTYDGCEWRERGKRKDYTYESLILFER